MINSFEEKIIQGRLFPKPCFVLVLKKIQEMSYITKDNGLKFRKKELLGIKIMIF